MVLRFEIITPEKIVYQQEVDQISVPTVNGEITILPHHVNLFTKIQPGEIKVVKGKSNEILAVTGGFLEVTDNKITLLADYAVRSEDIEATKAIEAQKRAEQLMREAKEKANDRDFALAESDLRKALLELKVATKRKALKNLPASNP